MSKILELFFTNEVKNAAIALVTASIFNEVSGKKKPKLLIDNTDLALIIKKPQTLHLEVFVVQIFLIAILIAS